MQQFLKILQKYFSKQLDNLKITSRKQAIIIISDKKVKMYAAEYKYLSSQKLDFSFQNYLAESNNILSQCFYFS